MAVCPILLRFRYRVRGGITQGVYVVQGHQLGSKHTLALVPDFVSKNIKIVLHLSMTERLFTGLVGLIGLVVTDWLSDRSLKHWFLTGFETRRFYASDKVIQIGKVPYG